MIKGSLPFFIKKKEFLESEVKDEYIKRDLWDKLDDPIYVKKGGIISLIGKTVIQNLIQAGLKFV